MSSNITNTPQSNTWDASVGRTQNVERLKNFLHRELLPAPASRRRLLIRNFAKSLPTGMTVFEQDELIAVFSLLFRDLPVRLYESFAYSMPSTAEYPLLSQHRQIVVTFVLEELAKIKTDSAQIVAAMERLFEGPLADLPRDCWCRLIHEFEFLITPGDARAWILELGAAHIDGDQAYIESVVSRPPSQADLNDIRVGQPIGDDIAGETLELRRIEEPEDNESSAADMEEYEVDDDDDDDAYVSSLYDTPQWLKCSMIVPQNTPPPRTPFYGPEVEGSESLNSLHDAMLDLQSLRQALADTTSAFILMVDEMSAETNSYARFLLTENALDLNAIIVPRLEDLTLEQGSRKWIYETLAVGKYITSRAMERLIDTENFFIAREEFLVAEKHTFDAYASRYERTRYRRDLNGIVAGLHNREHAELIKFPTSDQPAPIAKPWKGEDLCAICHSPPERLEGNLFCPPILTSCCKKPFHTNCILEWLFTSVRRGMTCPWCRSAFDLDFLGEVMEARVRELQLL